MKSAANWKGKKKTLEVELTSVDLFISGLLAMVKGFPRAARGLKVHFILRKRVVKVELSVKCNFGCDFGGVYLPCTDLHVR